MASRGCRPGRLPGQHRHRYRGVTRGAGLAFLPPVMRTLLPLVAAVALLAGGCATIHGYPVRESRGVETRQVGQILDPLLAALELPSLRAISASRWRIR